MQRRVKKKQRTLNKTKLAGTCLENHLKTIVDDRMFKEVSITEKSFVKVEDLQA